MKLNTGAKNPTGKPGGPDNSQSIRHIFKNSIFLKIYPDT